MPTSSTISDDQLEIHTGGGIVHALAFSPNGDYIVSGHDGYVRVWRVEDGKEMGTMEGAGGSFLCLAVSNDGKWIAAGAWTIWDQSLFLWDAKSFERVFDHEEDGSVRGLDFSPDSTTLLVASGNAVTIFDAASPERIRLGPLRHEDSLKAARYSPTGDRVATATDDYVRLWDGNDGHLLLEVKAEVIPHYNRGLLWVDHNHLFVVSRNEIQMLETSKGSKASECSVMRADNFSCIALSRHGEFVAYSTDRVVTFWDTSERNTRLGRIEHPESIHSIALSPDGRVIATGGANGKIVTGLSPINSHLDHLFRETDIHIDATILDFWKRDRLAEAETLLTAALSTSHDTGPYVLSCRAFVRARLKQWDAAILDAEKSINILPSFIGYISKSIALSGKGEMHKAYRACDLAFSFHHSMRVRFLLLVKAIIVFMTGEHEDAVSRVDDLIATNPFNSAYYMVRAYMYLLIGKSRMDNSDHAGAIEFLERARVRLINCVEDVLIPITLIFGWKFDSLGITIQQRLCEALYAAGRTEKAAESLIEILNTFEEEVLTGEALVEWVTGLMNQCLSASHRGNNAASKVDGFDEAPSCHATLDSMTATMLLREWAKSTLAFCPWRDALISSTPFTVPKSLVYRALCEHLETVGRIMEASECFRQMATELAEETNGLDEQTKWLPDFKRRCSAKLMDLGDTALDADRNDDAIAHYSATLDLSPTTPQVLLIKRSKAYLGKGSWQEALDDAEKVIVLDPLSPSGYERKRAALHQAGEYDKAIEAFEVMLSRMSQSPDIEIRMHRRNYVTPAQTMETIKRIVQDTIRDSPRVLIHTVSGHLCSKSEQAAVFESLPVFKQLISSMTTHIDDARIKKAVREYYRYATFSHKWEAGEPLFQKVIHIIVYDLEQSLTHDKLQMFCKIVHDSGINWAWSDTCCIDKTDHVVLQEAIVAMFKWYEGSSLTVIFLRGVCSPSHRGDLVKSIWNSRAWTFQEYHASKTVRFYTEDWKLYRDLDVPNHKECPEIISEMEEATGISAQALMSLRPGLDDIRTKLCLASQRDTTLVEDAAYSLLGIFSISLPVVYGERDKALGRLLAQLLATSGDTSILAWTGKSGSFNSCLPTSISVFGRLPTTHIPLVTDNTEMGKTISGLNSALVMKLYDRLVDLSVPSFIGGRLKLPCITFKLGPVPASKIGLEQVFRAQTTALGVVEIRTNENLSRMDSLYLIHPWIDSLLDRQPVGSVMDTLLEESEDATDPSLVGGLPLSSPSNVTRAPKPSRASRFTARFASPFSGQSTAPSLRPPSSVSQADKRMQARQTIARLKQPFGALLFTPSPGGVAAYRRVATENVITVQVVEEITPTVLSKLVDSVKILDVL